ncbi:MAG: SMP-30/gluconolactonase/LRE family protein [Proteobacteria bacterium]|nr:SMP-30/gluconolactonase/LRE family protein [Pseudomonadota bacterium]
MGILFAGMLTALLLTGSATAGSAEATTNITGSIERLSDAFNALVPDEAVIEKVADGFTFIEGPVWMPGTPSYLVFSDIPANTVYRWNGTEGTSVLLKPVLADDANTGGSGGSNGLALDADGRLILCEHGNRRIARLESDGSRTTLAALYAGKRLNSPNDIVFHSTGAAFFTDPPYGLTGLDADPAKEQAHNGVYRLDVDGTVTLLAAGQTRPNGIGLSPDERTLYVANSDTSFLWMSYAIRNDLTLDDGKVFFDASHLNRAGVPDGLTLDREGNIYATGPGGVLVFNPAGEHLGTIRPAEQPANVGWGDDGRTLYMTARTSLYRIKLSAQGLVYRGE